MEVTMKVLIAATLISLLGVVFGDDYKIEGKVEVTSVRDKDWIPNTMIFVDGGKYMAHLRSDGTFTINKLSSGSYMVEVINPNFLFEPARVDIASKGKLRARKQNHLQPSQVKVVPYPLLFQERARAGYFQQREQWRIQDFLYNPMVLTMVLPLVVIMVLPKLLNAADPETQKEMQNQMNAFNTKPNMPDMSEMITNLFSGGATKKPSRPKTSSSKRKS